MAKALAPPPTREEEQLTWDADRPLLRRLERIRRKTLTQTILPEWTQEDSLRLDLFGDPLSSSESQEPHRGGPPQPTHTVRAVERQAACLRLAHIIVGHAAWLRALYRRYLLDL